MCHFTAVDSEESAGAPEVEITDEMIEAGAAVLNREMAHDPFMSPSLADLLSEEILRAALSKQPEKTR